MHPQIFSLHLLEGLPPLVLHSYSLFMVLGLGAAVGVGVWLAGRAGAFAPIDQALALVIAFAGGLVGAKGLYVLLHVVLRGEPLSWAQLADSGGLVWYGGVLGGVGGYLLVHRRLGTPVALALDLGAPGAALGHAFGRLGCFFAGCCYGGPAPAGWPKVIFPLGGLAPGGIPLHPTQLYEAAGMAGIALCAGLAAARWPGAGRATWLYGALYAGLRFSLEALRADDRGATFGGLSAGQAVSLGVALLCLLSAPVVWGGAARVDRPGASG